MANMFEKLAKSAGEGFASKFNGGTEEEIYQFECENSHTFFIKVELPKSVYELTEMFKQIKCPLCENKQISVKKTL